MHYALPIGLGLALAGCSLAPKYVRGTPPVPASWPVGDAYLRQSEAALPNIGYRDVFRDTRLQALIETGLANNRDLRVAAANIAAARAQYRIQRAGLFPRVDAGGNYTRSQTSGSGAGTGGGFGRAGTTLSADIGITAFEIDLFGRLRSLSEAALNRYFATEAAARATRVALVGDIADAWLAYAADRSLLRVAEETVVSARRSVELTRARLQGGIAPRTDLAQAQQILGQAEADVAAQTTAVAQDANLLRLLIGGDVDAALLVDSIDVAGPGVAALPPGLDSTILLRRPDIVQAEFELRAANAEIGAARAALFPTISLTSVIGFASTALTSLFTGGAFTWSAGPAINYPIFRAGAGRAEVELSRAQRDAALASYERAIQTGFREVADGLARRGTLEAERAAVDMQAAAAADTFRLTEARYRGGVETFLASLDAQRSLYAARRTQANIRLVAASNDVTLYRALGGDAQRPLPAPEIVTAAALSFRSSAASVRNAVQNWTSIASPPAGPTSAGSRRQERSNAVVLSGIGRELPDPSARAFFRTLRGKGRRDARASGIAKSRSNAADCQITRAQIGRALEWLPVVGFAPTSCD